MVRILIEREDISYEKACDSNVGLWRAIFRKNNELVFVKKKWAFIHGLHMNPVWNKNLFLEKLAFEQSFRTYCRKFCYEHMCTWDMDYMSNIYVCFKIHVYLWFFNSWILHVKVHPRCQKEESFLHE